MYSLPIAFLPYEDEWVYSWFQRLAEANGMTLEMFKCFIYKKDKISRTNNWRLKGLFWLKDEWADLVPLKDILLKHSVFLGDVLSKDIASVCRQMFSLLYDRDLPLYDAPPISKKLRYRICPECIKEDQKAGKDIYVKTWHSYSDVTVCCKHKCGLIETVSYPFDDQKGKRFPYSEKALEKAEKLYRVFCSPEDADYNIRKYDDSDEVEVMKEYPLFTEYRCKKCKTTFLMPPYLISRGRGCPVCELSMDVPERMMRMNPGYGFTREIKSFGDKNCIYHKGCGHVYLKSAWNFLWDNKRWDCDCKNHSKQRKCMSKKELQEKLRLDDYDILDYKYNNRSYLLKLKCRICGSVFERPFYYDNLNSTICPKCREKKKEDKVHAFDQRIYELTGGEYVRVSDYVNEGVPIKIMHRKCQNIIMCMPGGFLRKGYRCSCEKTILTKELMEEVFSVFVQNFDILDYDKKTRIYTIRFKNGEIKRLHKGLVYQEATCKCKPEYFDREKEPWNFHK